MIRKRKSLFWQIYLSYILITLWSLIMVAWYSSRSFKQFYLTKTTENLKCCAFLTSEVMAGKLLTYDRHKINAFCKKINQSGKKIKIVVGGAPFNFDEKLWEEVGADIMGNNASDAMKIIKKFNGSKS